MSTDLKRAIRELIDDGLSEQGISDEIEKAGVACTQATINRIKLGRVANPSFAVGAGILQLHQRRSKGKSSGHRRAG